MAHHLEEAEELLRLEVVVEELRQQHLRLEVVVIVVVLLERPYIAGSILQL